MSGSLPFTTVTNETQLNADIEAADTLTNAGTYVINFGNAIAEGTLPGVTIAANGATAVVAPDLTAVDLHSGVTLVINGNGDVLNGENAYRGLFVYSGDVIVNDLTIANAVATGGAGATDSGGGGGGGAGLGGGLFIGATGTATLNQVYFSDDKATGGAGGGAKGKYGIYGGGGGLGGPGGGYYGYNTATGGGAGGGGGIGRTAAGGVLGNNHNFKASPGIVGSGANNPGSGGTGYNGTPSDDFPTTSPGGSFGGGGGYGYEYNNPDGESSGNRPGGAGGGGIGGSNGKNGATGSGYGKGGKGGFGGGGGGGYSIGGQGGFGGGGGVGYSTSGAGGWGGGGGGGVFKGTAGAGGFGGGAGAAGKYVAYGSPSDYGGGGGGGLGAGGDVFVYKGGSLIIGSGTLAGGSVAGGAGGVSSHSAAHNGGTGSAFGSGIFLYGNGQAATFTPALGKSVTVDDQIYDQKGAGNGSNTGLVILDGAGELILAATNSFWGGTTLEGGGTLELNASGAGGSGGITFGSGSNRLLINSSELPNGGSLVNTINGFAFGDVIELAGLGYATGATSLTVSGSIVKVTSNSQTDTLTVAS
ncbi:MAG TPA: hypothetical protein VME47_18600, partial [Acetobacteraceae bacterium]|nr:hypothetical protein [Acetobacteraceae bacterium]